MAMGSIAAWGQGEHVSTSDVDVRALGTALRAHRTRNGMTQRDLAELAGVSVRTVRAIERGHSERPRQASVRQLAGVLHGTASRPDTDRFHVDILGALRVRRDGRSVEIGSEHQRCLLGLLALHAGHPVSQSQIVGVLWDGAPPVTHRALLHTAVSRLRKLLGDGADRIVTHPHNGYVLTIDPHRLDLVRFDGLAAAARDAADPREALALFDRALACWRGPVLADLPERLRQHPAAIAAAAGRLSTVLGYLDIAMAVGAHEQAVARTRALIEDEPFHEGLHARLMLALAGTGQQAAALALFERIRERLRVELAVDPGKELRAAHLAVLRGQGSAPGGRSCLPRDLPDFTGRDTELRALLGGRAVCAVTSIGGMAGVGKTVLAVRLAHELAPHFPDGQLFLDLHAYTAGTNPLSARDALESLLRQFGVDGERIPARLDDCAALWRAVTTGQRLLLVLDNAADAAQLRPLLPSGPHTRTLITSRSQLTSLDGVHHLGVDVLPHTDAATLFARAVGRPVAGQEDAVAEVARLCGFLPLAVRIAAAKARAHPSWTVAHLAARLGDEHRRLTELHVGDRSVEAAFALSYRQLDEPRQRMFRLLGDSPTVDTDAYAAAALAGLRHTEVERLLDDLLDDHLLLEPRPGRFQCHDLIRQHARAAAAHHDPADARAAAQTRLAAYYLHAATHAADLLEPARRRWHPGVPEADLPRLTGQPDAVAWLTAEQHNLVAIVAASAAQGRWNDCWQLAQCLWRYFFVRGHLQDWVTTHRLALTAARRAGDTRAQAETHKNLGLAHWRRGDLTAALDHHHEALALDEHDADLWGQAKTHNHLGFIHVRMGHHAQALHHQRLAVDRYRAAGDDSGLAWAQIGLGDAYFQQGEVATSGLWFSRALDLTQSIGDRWGELHALTGLGFTRREAGRPLLEHALELARAVGDRWSECLALTGIGSCDRLSGATGSALDRLGQAAALAREAGDTWALRLALTELGHTLSEHGHDDEAIATHEEALALTRTLHNEHLEAQVLGDLRAFSPGSGGEDEPARRHRVHGVPAVGAHESGPCRHGDGFTAGG
jgi:DNA-binding SARP family transcriptional activator/tetratricopeptide (TPR) repeat protein/DNA-binding XRE family transcriptional regulator